MVDPRRRADLHRQRDCPQASAQGSARCELGQHFQPVQPEFLRSVARRIAACDDDASDAALDDELACDARGLWIARVDVNDPEAYKKAVAANAEPFAKYGARFLVRGGQHEVAEGTARQGNVVIEFPSYQVALDCYHSPEFAPVKAARARAVEGDLVIIEGYDGPQPGA